MDDKVIVKKKVVRAKKKASITKGKVVKVVSKAKQPTEPRLQGFAKPPTKKVEPVAEPKPKEHVNTGVSLVCEYRMAMRAQGDYELQARVGSTDAWTVLGAVRNEEEARLKIGLIKNPFIQL